MFSYGYSKCFTSFVQISFSDLFFIVRLCFSLLSRILSMPPYKAQPVCGRRDIKGRLQYNRASMINCRKFALDPVGEYNPYHFPNHLRNSVTNDPESESIDHPSPSEKKTNKYYFVVNNDHVLLFDGCSLVRVTDFLVAEPIVSKTRRRRPVGDISRGFGNDDLLTHLF